MDEDQLLFINCMKQGQSMKLSCEFAIIEFSHKSINRSYPLNVTHKFSRITLFFFFVFETEFSRST